MDGWLSIYPQRCRLGLISSVSYRSRSSGRAPSKHQSKELSTMYRLRQKIESDPSDPKILMTKPGGYQLVR